MSPNPPQARERVDVEGPEGSPRTAMNYREIDLILRNARADGRGEAAAEIASLKAAVEEVRGALEGGWLPIVLCPTDGVDRALRLPDGREVIGAFRSAGLGQKTGWQTKTPMEFDRPVYEVTYSGGFIASLELRARPEPVRKQVGTRKEVTWLIGDLPEGVYPTHFRPNDTVHGPAERAALAKLPALNPPRCHADRDGDCSWTGCPQLRDAEPGASGRHCPLDAATLSGETGNE